MITSKPPVLLDEKALGEHAFSLNVEQILWMEKRNPRTGEGPRQVLPQLTGDVEAPKLVGWKNNPKSNLFHLLRMREHLSRVKVRHYWPVKNLRQL